MKAKIKATGEIVDAVITQRVTRMGEQVYVTDDYRLIEESRLEFNVDSFDYWTRLEHQYAGMAMQGMLNNSYLAGEFRKDPNNGIEDMSKIITKAAAVYAHALVEKMKNKEE